MNLFIAPEYRAASLAPRVVEVREFLLCRSEKSLATEAAEARGLTWDWLAGVRGSRLPTSAI